MPKISKISVTYGRKFNLGDFKSATIEATVWGEVLEDEEGGPEDPADVARYLMAFCRDQVANEFRRIAKSAEPQGG